ncbi:DUF4386 domain-containing protein [Nesterenkonia sp. YGD6]|uniref:DUF4386 domain-containing protein n=1 Tax=Nesterenkonia sp. YGD6 TaxID=2901231 RepID=UPI001F4D0EEF|nr:DUF4386 domain-containing protein [Nesterenkonia sp. YGD6]MCH8563143.1 DUF4386 domain-containing protein [Nesterenkonia sp. YGD6]
MLDRRTAPAPDRRVARATGALYLIFVLIGVCGFLLIRPHLYDVTDPVATLSQLIANDSLARVGIALELGIALSQALVALWLFRLFRSVDVVAAGAVLAFGLVNAVAILTSAAMLATAQTVAGDPSLAPGGDAEATVQFAYAISANLWGAAAIFFGLWLIPMGLLVLHSGWMPRPLGWLLIVGGVGYILSAFVTLLLPDVGAAADALTIPAVLGEFWFVGYLLIRGARSLDVSTASGPALSTPNAI